MSSTEYKPNSHKYREEKEAEEKNIKPVVRGNVTVKKERIRSKFANTFLNENMSNVTEYVVSDVIIPAIVDTIVDAITGGVTMLFKGSPTARRRSSSSSGRTNYTSYSRGSDRDRRDERRYTKDRHGVLDVVFDTRGDALEVRDCILELSDKYHMLSITEFYELSKVPEDAGDYTDSGYGWTDLRPDEVQITRDRDGYRIKLPKPEPLN